LLAQADHVAGRCPFDETEGVPRHRGHDPLIFFRISVQITERIVGSGRLPLTIKNAAVTLRWSAPRSRSTRDHSLSRVESR